MPSALYALCVVMLRNFEPKVFAHLEMAYFVEDLCSFQMSLPLHGCIWFRQRFDANTNSYFFVEMVRFHCFLYVSCNMGPILWLFVLLTDFTLYTILFISVYLFLFFTRLFTKFYLLRDTCFIFCFADKQFARFLQTFIITSGSPKCFERTNLCCISNGSPFYL